MSKSDEPAWGERNAVIGYYPQYRLSAAMVIHRLREGTLSWIAVADPKAGRVDDFQIGGEQRVDAYQCIRYARMLYTFGDQRRPAEMIPDPPETRHMGWAYFQRGVCTIAKIWALSWRGRALDRATIRQEMG